jgi:hypothetical protein
MNAGCIHASCILLHDLTTYNKHESHTHGVLLSSWQLPNIHSPLRYSQQNDCRTYSILHTLQTFL